MESNRHQRTKLIEALGAEPFDDRSFDEMCEEVKDLITLRDLCTWQLAEALGYKREDQVPDWGDLIKEVKDLVAIRDAQIPKNVHPRKAYVTVDDNIKVGESYVRGEGINMPHVGATNYPTEAARIIFEVLWPKWKSGFLAKNAHYADTYKHLGIAGQYADIWRKVGPLKKLMWDNQGHVFFDDSETVADICNDLIGHLFLTLAMLKEGEPNVG